MPTAEKRFSAPPRSDIVDRALSAVAFALMLSAWAIVYVTVVPTDPAPARHVAVLQVRP